MNIERLGLAIDNKDREIRHLRKMLKQIEKIIEVKNDQIQLMRDTLADNKITIEDLRSEIKLLKNKL